MVIEFLSLSSVVILNSFITGVFTKTADLFVEHGYKASVIGKILLGISWGLFGSLVVIGNDLVAAFYFGILLSWIIRYKLDYYNHGIGGAMILLALFYTQPTGLLVTLICLPTLFLFTLFGVISRETSFGKKLGWFHKYNVYSFIYLGALSLYFPAVWIVFFASLSNVIGYHGIKMLFERKGG